MAWQFFSWYLALQGMTLATLPLTLSLFPNLPDRGYAFSKSVGVLAVGFVFWLGYSYGLVRNEAGGAWLMLIVVAATSWGVGRAVVAKARRRGNLGISWYYVAGVELLFLMVFIVWATVRAYDPAVNHTEEPMDLMFMYSLWGSATYPPHDAWLSGYPISYYYFGYWLLTTVGRLAGQPPHIGYVLGQASWYGLLWLGCFGLGYNLLARRNGGGDERALAGGLLTGLLVAAAGNLQTVMEWLYANGIHVTALANWFGVRNFPEQAAQTGLWHVSFDLWWWRPARVLSDRWLTGDHLEVIDEFPMFSYLLGDNHPHVLAMPFVLLLIALIFNLFLQRQPLAGVGKQAVAAADRDKVTALVTRWLAFVRTLTPFGLVGAVSLLVTASALVFLNTWDFPPYWLLFMVVVGLLVRRELMQTPTLTNAQRWRQAIVAALLSGGVMVAGIGLLLWPYFLTAQSQAAGLLPNLFNPTRLPQFIVMFAFALLGIGAFLGLSGQWLAQGQPLWRKAWRSLATIAALVYGLPLLFLGTCAILVTTPRGQTLLAGLPLPPGAAGYLPFFTERWGAQFWTFLFVGALLAVALWLIWCALDRFWEQHTEAISAEPQGGRWAALPTTTLFVLLLAALGLLLVFAPEFIYLRDNFGIRMNTVFKFYYQAWLLFGVVASYAIVVALSEWQPFVPKPAEVGQRNALLAGGTMACAVLALVLGLAGLVYPLAGLYSKTGGFVTTPTFDSSAYLADGGSAELAAVLWVRANTAPAAVVVEGKGNSYWNHNRISTMTGRPTLLGWASHEEQWRGKAYADMAQGREAALETIYRGTTVEAIAQVLEQWQIDYVYVGPTERQQYTITVASEQVLAAAMDIAFDQGNVRIYQRR